VPSKLPRTHGSARYCARLSMMTHLRRTSDSTAATRRRSTQATAPADGGTGEATSEAGADEDEPQVPWWGEPTRADHPNSLITLFPTKRSQNESFILTELWVTRESPQRKDSRGRARSSPARSQGHAALARVRAGCEGWSTLADPWWRWTCRVATVPRGGRFRQRTCRLQPRVPGKVLCRECGQRRPRAGCLAGSRSLECSWASAASRLRLLPRSSSRHRHRLPRGRHASANRPRSA